MLPIKSNPTGIRFAAQDTLQEIEQSLRLLLDEIPLENALKALSKAGARNATLVDLCQTGLPLDTDLGDGLRSGDMIGLITFGLRRGFVAPDLRIQVKVGYDSRRVITGVEAVRRFAK